MGEVVFYITVITIVLLISFYNLLIAILGLFPRFRATAVGTLQKTRTQRNVRTRRGLIIPFLTNYTYKYTANGKKYRYSNLIYSTRSRLHQKVPMVYVKWFPRYAYPKKFTASTQWIFGIGMLIMGILFIIAVVIA